MGISLQLTPWMVPPPTGRDVLGSWEYWQGKTIWVNSGLFSVGVSQAPHHLDWQGVDLDSGSNRGLGCELVSVGYSG